MCVCVCVCVWCFFYHVLYSLWVKMQEIKAAGDTMSVLSRKWHCDLSSLNAVSTLFVSLWPRCSVTERWSRYHLVSLTLALRSGPLFIGGFIEDSEGWVCSDSHFCHCRSDSCRQRRAITWSLKLSKRSLFVAGMHYPAVTSKHCGL